MYGIEKTTVKEAQDLVKAVKAQIKPLYTTEVGPDPQMGLLNGV
jgi:hypothetical protein